MARNISDEMRESVKIINDTRDVYDRDTVWVHISVLENGEWVGDFHASFNRRVRRGGVKYVADWTDVNKGNGIYIDQHPTFWPVQVAAERLNEQQDVTFQAIDSGPNDK